jgi:hypothetical protein
MIAFAFAASRRVIIEKIAIQNFFSSNSSTVLTIERMFEKPHIGARRLSIRRVAAMSMRVSEVCTLYS